MKKLQEILNGIETVQVTGSTDVQVHALQLDSRKVGKNDLFIAVKGSAADGHHFIPNVIEQGAGVIVCECMPTEKNNEVTYVQVANARKASALLAANFYDQPSQKLKLVGVTGTNGKTTIATLLYEVYKDAGHKSGLLSTIENKIDGEVIPQMRNGLAGLSYIGIKRFISLDRFH